MKPPVRVARFTHVSWPEGTPRREQRFETGAVLKSYWQVYSNLVNCGHEHATEEEAQVCLEPTREKYRQIRWKKKTPTIKNVSTISVPAGEGAGT